MQDSLMRAPLSAVCGGDARQEEHIPCKLLLVDVDLLGRRSARKRESERDGKTGHCCYICGRDEEDTERNEETLYLRRWR